MAVLKRATSTPSPKVDQVQERGSCGRARQLRRGAYARRSEHSLPGDVRPAEFEMRTPVAAFATQADCPPKRGRIIAPNIPSAIYEHHSPFLFPKWAFASDEAPRILR